MSCKDLTSRCDPVHLCEDMRIAFPECRCESESVSVFSPSPVADNEILARQIFSPIHIDPETGKVTPAAFSDVANKGLSVSRLTYCPEEEVDRKGDQKARVDTERGRKKSYHGFIRGRCGDLRAIKKDDGQRLFCVYDTAFEHDAAHADACQAVDQGPSANKKARKILRDQFEKVPWKG